MICPGFISISINLTDPNDYKGGGLKIYPSNIPSVERGLITVFPSFLRHAALPVKEGTRYALISWINGNAFK